MADTREVISAVEERLTDPSSRSLADAVAAVVRDGVLVEGDALPPIRAVAKELLISPTTVSSAWRILLRAGVIRTQGRRGTIVGAPSRPRSKRYAAVLAGDDGLWDLSTGVPDAELLPPLGAALASLPTSATARSYLDDPVLPELREAVLADWPYAPDVLTIVDGAMDAIDLVVRTALRLGEQVAVENPCFPPLVDVLESVGVQVVGVPLDDAGMDPEALATAIKGGVTAVVLQGYVSLASGLSSLPRYAVRRGCWSSRTTRWGRRRRRRRSVWPSGSRVRRCTCAVMPRRTGPTCAWRR